jgi:hypothetical protein
VKLVNIHLTSKKSSYESDTWQVKNQLN